MSSDWSIVALALILALLFGTCAERSWCEQPCTPSILRLPTDRNTLECPNGTVLEWHGDNVAVCQCPGKCKGTETP